ncbi:hypothetical protein GG496_000907 [Candidatus Fervidibacteria bacterium JGI MDM2 JNZ-1-D12]
MTKVLTEIEVKVEERSQISWRAFIWGLLLIPVAAYWMARRGQDGIMSLSVPPVAFVFLLAVLNFPFARWLKRFALTQADLAALWAMLAVATGIACEWAEAPGLSGFLAWFDNPANRYSELIQPYVPSWMIHDYKDALRAFFGGHQPYDLYRLDHLRAWLVPFLGWSGLIITLVFLMLCLLILLAPRWLEQERLSYPIATVPIYLSHDGWASRLLPNWRFWFGFIIAAIYDTVYGLVFWWRGQTSQAWKGIDISQFIINRPWNVIGWTPIPLLPFMMALSYFIPADMAFSGVFFFWFRKAQQIIASALGHDVVPLWGGMAGAARVPYLTEQSVGAMVALFCVYMWHTKGYLLSGVGANLQSANWSPMLRFGLSGLVVGLIALLGFVVAMKGSAGFLMLYLLIFIAISTAVSKIRAQIGPPIHEFAFMGANRWFIDLLGAERLGDRNITIMGFLYFTHRIWRSHPMPQMADGFKVVHEAKALDMRFVAAMVFAIVWGTMAMYWARLQAGYIWGSGEPWGYAGWIMEWRNMKEPNYTAAAFGVGGAIFTLALVWVHNRFPFLPLHPAAYALAMNFGIDYCWFPMLLAGLAKTAIVRYGGQRAYHALVPFALGIVVGEFLTGSVWSWIWILTGRPTYSFSIN